MRTDEFIKLADLSFSEARNVSPIKTGNLRYNAMSVEILNGGNTYKIYVKQDIAPYMPYTNEPWVAKRWNGKKNPNEGWWQDKALQAVLQAFQSQLSRVIIKTEKR